MLRVCSDMVLLSEGITAHWLFTAKSSGTVLKRKCADLHPDKIKARWMRAAKRNPKNFERHVAMIYDGEVYSVGPVAAAREILRIAQALARLPEAFDCVWYLLSAFGGS